VTISRTIAANLLVLASVVLLGGAGPAPAQQPKTKGPVAGPHTAQAAPAASPSPGAATPNTPPPPGWVPRCASNSREAPLECAIEESAYVTKTGQLLVQVDIRVTSDTRTPVGLLLLPLGLNLPVGAKLQVDSGKPVDVQIQTCEQRGCFVNLPVSPELLAQLKSGKELKVSFQNLAKETMTIPLPLADFAAAYDKIK
jgi:invasion protein IalB